MTGKKTTLKELLQKGQVFAPCIYDCLSAKAVELAGFSAMLLSGGALAYSMCGLPDLGLLTVDELVWATTRITDTSPLPLIIDADDGYGDSPLNVYRTVQRLVKAGAMAVTIDDSTGFRGWERGIFERERKLNKPHEIVPKEKFLSKIKAAVEACKGSDCIIIARSEAKPSCGIDESIDRLIRARKLGAHMTMIIGIKTLEEAKKADELDPGWKMWPDISVTNGKSDVELDDIARLGFNLVTMHYTEKGAMWGMLGYGMRTMKDKNTVYIDEHDFDGMLPGKDHHVLLTYWKKWMPMEEGFNDLGDVSTKKYDIRFD